ncbi:hypothetical protein QBC46DRAFT_406913 [Diplogelasinospora grovesii]|uniref:Extracellular membrane protein CFEM domain-containing protein n=1 Tax=Diplogelasinospora grovesii TaxID=303347 RepID=A0AAN6NAI9_9PEZI|nr:hypothetical protein QBC46DRAFT_406913 [Diplogelasinospora grovesii]
MAFAGHMRLALVGGAVLVSFLSGVEPASSSGSFITQFPDCVANCAQTAGCGIMNPKCMCKGAQGSFLETVLSCMYTSCPSQLNNAEDGFLKVMEIGCAAIGKSIPDDDMERAETVCSSLISKLSTTSTSTQRATAHPATMTLKTTKATATTEDSASQTATDSTTSAEVQSTSTSSSSDDSTSAPTTLAVATSPTPQQSEAQSSTSTAAAANSDPTDSSPFATPNFAASRDVGAFIGWMGVPLAIAMALR